MSGEAKVWLHAAGWATVALLRGIQLGHTLGTVLAAWGVAYTVAFVCLTWNDDRKAARP